MTLDTLWADLVEWKINKKHFLLGKFTVTSSLDKNPILPMLVVGFKPTTSLVVASTPKLACCLYHWGLCKFGPIFNHFHVCFPLYRHPIYQKYQLHQLVPTSHILLLLLAFKTMLRYSEMCVHKINVLSLSFCVFWSSIWYVI